MAETKQKSEETVRVIPRDVGTQLVEKANDLQELERRVNALQSDITQLSAFAHGSRGPGAQEQAPAYPRLAPPSWFPGLSHFGPVAPGFVPAPGIPGTVPNLLGGAPVFQLPVGSETLTTREFGAMPSVTKQPGVNIVDAGDEYIVQVELPATKKKDLELLGSDRSITLTAQVRPDPEGIEGTIILGEVTPTVYRRIIHLPTPCNTGKSKANLRDGVLTLNIPKKDPSNGLRRIDVAYG